MGSFREFSLRRFDGWPACCARMIDIAADFGELTEQAVRELLVAARAAQWSDAQACTLALIIANSAPTERAAATLDEAVPGLRRLSPQQLAHESLRGHTAAVARLVRSFVRGAGRPQRSETYGATTAERAGGRAEGALPRRRGVCRRAKKINILSFALASETRDSHHPYTGEMGVRLAPACPVCTG